MRRAFHLQYLLRFDQINSASQPLRMHNEWASGRVSEWAKKILFFFFYSPFLPLPLSVFICLFPVFCDAESEPQKKIAFFEEKVRPIFEANCYVCHSGANPKKDLNLSDLASVMQRDSEKAVIKPNDAESSLLFQMVSSKKMPPPEFSDPLSSENIEVLRRWINDGAIFVGVVGAKQIASPSALPSENGVLIPKSTDKRAGLDWWSLQKIIEPSIPEVKDTAWVKNPIDRFVLAKIEAMGAQQAVPLHPAPKADKLTLIRRVTFDLTGLTPTPEEIDAFLKDDSPDAYERLVDRLLASPHYGERWARHWLDIVRFGESHGFEVDSLRDNAWRYRDYVISAFNEDKPYNQFIIEQLAGDAFYSEDPNLMAATGFLVAGPWDTIGNNLQASVLMRTRTRMDELDDMINVTAATFLGLTVSCARCHDRELPRPYGRGFLVRRKEQPLSSPSVTFRSPYGSLIDSIC